MVVIKILFLSFGQLATIIYFICSRLVIIIYFAKIVVLSLFSGICLKLIIFQRSCENTLFLRKDIFFIIFAQKPYFYRIGQISCFINIFGFQIKLVDFQDFSFFPKMAIGQRESAILTLKFTYDLGRNRSELISSLNTSFWAHF